MSGSIITLPWQFKVGANLLGTPTAGGAPNPWKWPPEYLIATNGQNAMWYIKQAFKGSGAWTDTLGAAATAAGNWLVRGSCDGSGGGGSFGNNDGVDRWVAATNLIAANSGSNHSWIVLAQPNISPNYELCIDLNVAGQNYSATMVVSPNKRFGAVGGGADGTATARPTALDEIVIVNGVSWGVSSLDIASTRIQIMKSADGTATRVIFCRCGFTCGLWCFERPARPSTNWDNPSLAMVLASAAARISAPFPDQTTLNTQSNFKGRTKNHPSGVAFGVSLAVDYTNGVTPTGVPNPNDLDSQTPFYPIDLMSLTTFGSRGRVGVMQDAWYTPWNNQDGVTFPTDDTRQWIMVGRLAMPWNRSVAIWH